MLLSPAQPLVLYGVVSPAGDSEVAVYRYHRTPSEPLMVDDKTLA